jgi:hypothetical protein
MSRRFSTNPPSASAARNLPMSPFGLRHDVQLDRLSGRTELRPQPSESPFSQFLMLTNALDSNQRAVAPQAYADAEMLAETADAMLQGERYFRWRLPIRASCRKRFKAAPAKPRCGPITCMKWLALSGFSTGFRGNGGISDPVAVD